MCMFVYYLHVLQDGLQGAVQLVWVFKLLPGIKKEIGSLTCVISYPQISKTEHSSFYKNVYAIKKA